MVACKRRLAASPRPCTGLTALPYAVQVPHASETCELFGDHLQRSPDQLLAGSSFKHTGYAFDHPGFESFFHEEVGVPC